MGVYLVKKFPQLIVKPDELAKFRKKFVSLFGLAHETEVNFRAVKKALDAAGVEPVFDRKKIAKMFYSRKKVPSSLNSTARRAPGRQSNMTQYLPPDKIS